LDRASGISYTEFSYQLLQAYDFYHLYKQHGCQLQIGGSDQWGNILAGINLIQRKTSTSCPVYGLTTPLLTTKSGEKFGKSAGNAIWLCPTKTTYYDFYQSLMKTEDSEVRRLLTSLTFLDMAEIEEVMVQHEVLVFLSNHCHSYILCSITKAQGWEGLILHHASLCFFLI
jgi:tyrosyl-tRNA synthetase